MWTTIAIVDVARIRQVKSQSCHPAKRQQQRMRGGEHLDGTEKMVERVHRLDFTLEGQEP